MSQGAVFNLVLRDERYDAWLTSSDYLRSRLVEVRKHRLRKGLANPQPTFADLERSHILYVRASYRPYVAIASEYLRVGASGDGAAAIATGGTLEFTFPSVGHFTSDVALHIRLPEIGSASALAEGAPATPSVPLYRYCAYPGLRALRNVAFKSTQLEIDSYTTDDAVAHHKHMVKTDHRVGWDRCHGQQEERHASYTANGFTGTLTYRDGPQTPRFYQPGFDMFIPLQLWMVRDASQALLNDLVPNTQRTVVIDLAPLDQLLYAYAPNPDAPSELMRVPLPISRLPIVTNLYVNNLWTNPEVHDIFASRTGFSLLRVHQRMVKPLQNTVDRVQLTQLKYPLEYLMAGIRSRQNADDPDHWILMGAAAERPPATKLVVPALIWNAALGINQLVAREARDTSTLEPIAATMSITAHGIDLYPQAMPASFYNAYLPIRYAPMSHMVAPLDASALLVSFCLYPGARNVSGNYNASAGRELYLNYTLRPDSALTVNYKAGDASLVVCASALNFLVRKGDQVSLRYST